MSIPTTEGPSTQLPANVLLTRVVGHTRRYLRNNGLTGTLPTELGKMTALAHWYALYEAGPSLNCSCQQLWC